MTIFEYLGIDPSYAEMARAAIRGYAPAWIRSLAPGETSQPVVTVPASCAG